jgi:hypothetical protein
MPPDLNTAAVGENGGVWFSSTLFMNHIMIVSRYPREKVSDGTVGRGYREAGICGVVSRASVRRRVGVERREVSGGAFAPWRGEAATCR